MAKRPPPPKKSPPPAPHAASKRIIFRRTILLMLSFGAAMFIPLINQLYSLAILHNDDYRSEEHTSELQSHLT